MEENLKIEKDFLALIELFKNQKDSFVTRNQLNKLKSYEIILSDFFLWNYQDLYLKLLLNLLDSKISCDNFSEQLGIIRVTHICEFDQLIKELELMNCSEINSKFLTKLNINIHALGFGNFIDRLDGCCEIMVSDERLKEIGGPREVGEIDETQFRKLIKKCCLEFLESHRIILASNDKSSKFEEFLDDLLVKLQHFSEFENSTSVRSRDQQILNFVMIFFTLLTFLTYSFLKPTFFI